MLKRSAFLIVVLLAAGCDSSNLLAASGDNGHVTGDVTRWAGESRVGAPVPNVTVQLRPRYRGGLLQRFRWQAGSPVAETTTDSLGRFEVRARPGTYFVAALMPPERYLMQGCPTVTRVFSGRFETDAKLVDLAAVRVSRGRTAEQQLKVAVVCPH
ncbi:carboxypeptidase-like regulatory domain-containing protein [Rubricoccus marinus]|uniref:Prealbumin-like fold domain-containing protein n=1 Tax=Rubricoccus marinus TaxID=716817 RepID=A0A259TYY4_9BACT|nr:carboxypeptidase-like regulatory domain-containing protein [Rubricoccus marinus]OZC02921.1 hypothetical protein BSZ36_08010 [Rubricoccus marinus]